MKANLAPCIHPPARRARLRILLADDHQIFRESLAQLLRRQDDFEIVGEAADGEQALALARSLQPDVVLLDISMPRLDGLSATRQISRELPAVKIIACSMHSHDDRAASLCAAGAAAYVDKSGPTADLLDAIRRCGTRPTRAPAVRTRAAGKDAPGSTGLP